MRRQKVSRSLGESDLILWCGRAGGGCAGTRWAGIAGPITALRIGMRIENARKAAVEACLLFSRPADRCMYGLRGGKWAEVRFDGTCECSNVGQRITRSAGMRESKGLGSCSAGGRPLWIGGTEASDQKDVLFQGQYCLCLGGWLENDGRYSGPRGVLYRSG